MITRELLSWANRELISLDSGGLDARVLLGHITGRSSASLIAGEDVLVPEHHVNAYREIIGQRKTGYPVAYLCGAREFWSLPFFVNENVLIPRPETELVVERALHHANQQPVESIADLGTGSGAIALSVAHELSGAQLVGTDVSDLALDVARRNQRNLSIENARFVKGDWYAAFESEESVTQFDLILSNPPYIDPEDEHLLTQEIKHEPRLALVAPDQGEADLRAIIENGRRHLQPGGWLVLEHGYQQAGTVAEMMVQAGYRSVMTHKDLMGHDRVTEGQK